MNLREGLVENGQHLSGAAGRFALRLSSIIASRAGAGTDEKERVSFNSVDDVAYTRSIGGKK